MSDPNSIKNRRSGTRTGNVCAVPLCNNNQMRNKELSFHGYPKDPTLRKEWIRRTKRQGVRKFSEWVPTKYHKICGIHFNKSGKKGYMDEYPVYFPWKDYTANTPISMPLPQLKKKTAVVEAGQDTCEPQDLLPQALQDIDRSITSFCSLDNGSEVEYPQIIVHPTSVVGPMTLDSVFKTESNVDSSHTDHNYGMTLDSADASNLKALNEQKRLIDSLLIEKSALRTQNTKLRAENVSLKMANSDLEKKCKCLDASLQITNNKPLQATKFGINSIAFNDEKVKFFTGFKTYLLLLNFYELMIRGYELNNPVNKHTGRPLSLDYHDQIFLVLCRLRLGLLEADLAQRFDISESTVSRIWGIWIPFMAQYLSLLGFWPSRRLVQKYMPESFKKHYPTTRVILDCTEIFIENPSEFRVQSETYSTYKSHNTAKGLVGITPNGVVSFVSDLYGGKVSDKVITGDSGIYDLLEAGDSVMADRGFVIEDSLTPLGTNLNIPPFLRGKKQMSLNEERLTRKIANLRIHVERVIGNIKQYRILKCVFPNSMSQKLNHIWKICCYLNNFNDEPLLDRKPLSSV